MPHAFPQWRGFELAPDGHLLDQLVDLSGPMGLAYERSVGFHKDFHAHDRPMIVLPRGSCVVKVRTAGGRRLHTVDSASLLIVPRGLRHDDESVTAIFDTVALYPAPALLDQVAEDERIAPAQVRRFVSRCQTLPRSGWLEQLVQEYFFARVVSRGASAQTLAFFERQMVVELLASGLRRTAAAATGRAAIALETVTGRALRYIESNIFSKLTLPAIARQAFASPSTLLRQFKQHTGTTPHRYIQVRRLEEARRVLEAGTHAVGDVAVFVGYESFGAFSAAFKARFGRSPSSVLGRRPRPRPGSSAR